MVLINLRSFRDVRIIIRFLSIAGFMGLSYQTEAQNSLYVDSNQSLTLDQCIDYAFKHQPALFQSYINQSITKTTNAINLSGWYPQINLGGNFTHYNQLPTSFTTDSSGAPEKIRTGVVNYSRTCINGHPGYFQSKPALCCKSCQFLCKAVGTNYRQYKD